MVESPVCERIYKIVGFVDSTLVLAGEQLF